MLWGTRKIHGQPPFPRPTHPVPLSPGPSSAFRHIEGVVLPRTTHITNLRGLSLTTPGECDGFCANRHLIAIPLLATGGQVAILEVKHHPHPQGHGRPQIAGVVVVFLCLGKRQGGMAESTIYMASFPVSEALPARATP